MMAATQTETENFKVKPSHLVASWKSDVSAVKTLFLERKYRKCSNLCKQLITTAKHPIHKTFLHFYQAVCYESLGHIAHNYSSNKIPLLEQARDAFSQALQALPLPFITAEDGEYSSPGISPGCPTLDILPHYQNDTLSLNSRNSKMQQTTTYLRTQSTSSVYSSSDSDTPLDVGKRHDLQTPRGTEFNQEEISSLEDMSIFASYKTRLSESLSNPHIVDEELVPSPLFSEKPKSRKEGSTPSGQTYEESSIETPSKGKPLPVTPVNRTLPNLPFNHQSIFELRDGRHQLIPRRKAALSTLISRFEGDLPLGSPSPRSTSTSFTPRFQRISAAFLPHLPPLPSHIDPTTPSNLLPYTPAKFPLFSDTEKHRECTTETYSHDYYSASLLLTHYNDLLTSFRTQIFQHISTVNARIELVEHLQHEYHVQKVTRGLNGTRLASFWSFKAAEQYDSKNAKATQDDAKIAARKEKIAKLKAERWTTVNKESHGWKGTEYYEALRTKVDMELGQSKYRLDKT